MIDEFLKRYFPTNVDYPKLQHLAEILPFGTLWSYVPSSLLNGLVNSCSDKPPVAAYLLGRYIDEDVRVYQDSDDGFNAFGKPPTYQDPPGSRNWKLVDIRLTKRELFDLLTQPRRLYHSPLGAFGDDMLLLYRSVLEDNRTCYWFFWFDCDVSDCLLGRFITEDSEPDVLSRFEAYVKSYEGVHSPWSVPSAFFSGWVSF